MLGLREGSVKVVSTLGAPALTAARVGSLDEVLGDQ